MITVRQVTSFLDRQNIKYHVEGDETKGFTSYCPLNSLCDNAIIWARTEKNLDYDKLAEHKGLILVVESDVEVPPIVDVVIMVENAHRTYFRIVQEFFADKDPENRSAKICSSAVVETEMIGSSVFIGHHTYIGPDVIIGDHVQILHNVTIEGNVWIGDYTVIESGTTIGACGFGHYKDEEGKPVCVPHFGGVRIGKHVKIGANNAISRGCLADTIIEDYVKTDNLCHIAHNDCIKTRAMLTANTVISGSTIVGENAWLAPGTLLNNSIVVGDNAFTGIGTVATKSIPEGKIVVGMPAKVLRDR